MCIQDESEERVVSHKQDSHPISPVSASRVRTYSTRRVRAYSTRCVMSAPTPLAVSAPTPLAVPAPTPLADRLCSRLPYSARFVMSAPVHSALAVSAPTPLAVSLQPSPQPSPQPEPLGGGNPKSASGLRGR